MTCLFIQGRRDTPQNQEKEKSALLWQKEASNKSDISSKRAKCVRHFCRHQWYIMMSDLTYLLAGWMFMHKIWPGRRAHDVKYDTSIPVTQIYMVCHLLPFAIVGQKCALDMQVARWCLTLRGMKFFPGLWISYFIVQIDKIFSPLICFPKKKKKKLTRQNERKTNPHIQMERANKHKIFFFGGGGGEGQDYLQSYIKPSI